MTMLSLYAIWSSDGKYYRSKGFGGSGKNWVDDISKAKIFPKEGIANRIISWWVNNYPNHPAPSLVKLNITSTEVIQTNVNAIRAKKLKNALKREKRILTYQLAHAQSEATKTAAQVKKLEEQLKNLP